MEVSIRNRLRKQDLVLLDEEVPDSQSSNINSVDYSEVKELVLDGVKLRELKPEDSEFLARFSNLQHLSLNATGLQKLDNFPPLDNLRILELQDNHISGGLDVLSNYKSLRCLLLGGNKIRDFAQLCSLKELPNLETLSLLLNPVAENNPDSYRSIVFETIPNLVVLDEMDKDGKEVEDYGYEEEEVEVLDDETVGEAETGHSEAHEISDDADDDDEDDDADADADDDDEDDDEDDDDDGVDLKEFYENDLDEDDDDDGGDFEPGNVDLDNEVDEFEDDCEDDDDEDEDDETEIHLKKQRVETETSEDDS